MYEDREIKGLQAIAEKMFDKSEGWRLATLNLQTIPGEKKRCMITRGGNTTIISGWENTRRIIVFSSFYHPENGVYRVTYVNILTKTEAGNYSERLIGPVGLLSKRKV